jgi:hypothetical protein
MEMPAWWEWELEISSHCLKRMQDRGFSETDLRAMLDDATDLVYQDHGTYLVFTTRDGAKWEVIVSPDDEQLVVVAVTAYPAEE